MRPPTDLLEFVERSAPIAAKLRALRKGELVYFEHVTPAAQPFLAALIARQEKGAVWVICETVRAQEIFFNELLTWFPDTLFVPEREVSPAEGAVPDPEITAERLDILHQLSTTKRRRIAVVTRTSLEDEVPSPEGLKALTLTLKKGQRLDRDAFLAQLDAAGYERVPQVSLRGQYAVRGGILDFFSWQQALPTRIELFDDEIESLRQFDLDAQTSVHQLETCSVLLGEGEEKRCALKDYIDPAALTIDAGGGFENARAIILEGSRGEEVEEDYSGAFHDHGLGEFDTGDLIVEESKRARFLQQLEEWAGNGWRIYIFCNNEGEIERLQDLIPEQQLASLNLPLGLVSRGFTFPAGKVAVLSDAELFGRYRNAGARRMSQRLGREQIIRSQIDFSELNEGDLVVHLEHGIGKYLGLQKFSLGDGKEEEVLTVEFANEAKLYVPLEQASLVSRYVGVGKRLPPLSVLGDGKWAKAKKSAEQAAFQYASKLLSLHAERETSVGYAFAPDGKWQQEFERSFLFKETPDQLTAITDTKADMESARPMDRLICGDVGFGKTEVAIRAAFKSVMNGKQVAVLVPTTVLAQQHYRNFKERMSDYPVRVEMLSRFRTAAEQRKALEGLADGSVDIVVGTHRLISRDVQFKDLGLVVIDEEQRFGVLHKEKFKLLFKLVDVLTLSATPIPRTLYLSLMGAKDMSVIETPPMNRIPTETIICGYDERIIRQAIERELQRQGQVYFLHNRIETIERIAQRVRMLCPKAKVAVGHGQMEEDELEMVMQKFVAGETDVLVSTTIIESGLDIPNANTIIIDRADRFGLADLYQLRGRVGRAQHKAYAYLMLPREMMTVGAARKRINAIKQYSSLGAGFKIAMRDLEIRGAGNILGTAQSGHIVAVGFDLYCQLLKHAITKLKGEKTGDRTGAAVRLDFIVNNEAEFTAPAPDRPPAAAAYLPVAYVSDAKTRIQSYRQLAEAQTQEQLEKVRKAWRDRFGPLPEAADNLLVLREIERVAGGRKITRVEVKEGKLMLTRGGDFVLIGGKFPRLTSKTPTLALREVLALIRSF